MKFKAGDRVHVTRHNDKDVNFYGTIAHAGTNTASLINCTDHRYEKARVYTPNSRHFGQDKMDYFELVKDEEDTEEPEVQRISDVVPNSSGTKFIEKALKDNLNKIEEIMNNDVPTHYQDVKECKVCEPAHGRRYIRLKKLKSFITDHYLDYTLRVGKGYKGAKFKKHKLMLLDRGEVCAHVNINYCPMCGRKLKNSERLYEPTQ